jgi:hypothetical protein
MKLRVDCIDFMEFSWHQFMRSYIYGSHVFSLVKVRCEMLESNCSALVIKAALSFAMLLHFLCWNNVSVTRQLLVVFVHLSS